MKNLISYVKLCETGQQYICILNLNYVTENLWQKDLTKKSLIQILININRVYTSCIHLHLYILVCTFVYTFVYIAYRKNNVRT